ncbi:integral membrane protein GPR155 isoform X2 [Pararge aegeria]|uniref:integral membrane protein GPR155 isoform X2 n=1 Tax=Pararge aegeria TaxID=116150 RepID=UPI0019D120FF|nr:integral membrane protein GPR155 isoform X2 [Pararge aegeria]
MGAQKLISTDTVSEDLIPALFQCFTIILCGYVAGRINAVSKVESKGIASFVGIFALPSLIFLSLARLNFSNVNWTFLLAILIAKGLVFFAVIIVTLSITKPMNLGQGGIFAIFCTQSNDFALGFPIINAIYGQTHPEYALYLYLMAPISLAILNPLAFVLMEIHKQRQYPQTDMAETRQRFHGIKMLLELAKSIVLNPVLVMTVLGIIGNIAFKHELSFYLTGLLDVFGKSFSATALFLLGLRMVGQITRLKGSALLLPCVLIMVKLIILPVIMREFVSMLDAGFNAEETQALSTYAFLYGTIPTAPAVFVFSNLYQLEIDLMAFSMVICTLLSAPITYISAQMMAINKDYAVEIKKLGFDLSIVSFLAATWVLTVFVLIPKIDRIPHRFTAGLLTTQIFLASSVILGGPYKVYSEWLEKVLPALEVFTTYSCFMWIAMLTVGLLLLESRGPSFAAKLWPVFCFVAWGTPGVMVAVLLVTKEVGTINTDASDAIRLGLVIFCITLTTGCLILYVRFRRRRQLFPSSMADMLIEPTATNETSSLVENAVPNSHTQSISNYSCYGTITATPSPNKNGNCCSNDPNCNNGFVSSITPDMENMAKKERTCACPPQNLRCTTADTCPYLNEMEEAANEPGLLPPEQSLGSGGQLTRHTVLIIVYVLMMFLDLTYTGWKIMRKDESGVFIEIEYLNTIAIYGQALVVLILFGIDPDEVLMPIVRCLRMNWFVADTVVLPAVEDLSFETKHVCDQFIAHHLERCRDAIAKDTRLRMRTYRNVFRGSSLVSWLIQCGLAADKPEAVQYGRHLLDGRLIAHIHNKHHFKDSPLLYTFK